MPCWQSWKGSINIGNCLCLTLVWLDLITSLVCNSTPKLSCISSRGDNSNHTWFSWVLVWAAENSMWLMVQHNFRCEDLAIPISQCTSFMAQDELALTNTTLSSFCIFGRIQIQKYEFKQQNCMAYWRYYRINHNNVDGFEVVLTFSRMGQFTHPLSKIQILRTILIVTLLTAIK